MVVRVAHVSVVKKPDVPVLKDLMLGVAEEVLKVFNGFDEITKPNHSGQVASPSLKESSSQLD